MATQRVIFVLGDISGYTRFIRFHGVSLVHAERLISELLESVIASAELPLDVYELDGDAVTFCAIDEDGESCAGDVFTQVECLMEAFRKRASELITEASICLCDACQRMGQLRLKMIIHRGNAAFVQVRQFNKVGGEDIILAHRLLKNGVPSDEYILMTEQFMEACSTSTFENHPVQTRVEQVEGFGDKQVHVIDFQTDGEPEAAPSTLGAKLKMFAAVEGYLFKRLLFKPSEKYSNLDGL